METILLIILLILVILFIAFYFRVYIYSWFIEFPNPIYSWVVQKNVYIPMHDGVRLCMDIYLPKIVEKCPVILLRTPYGKSGNIHPYKQMALLFASQGYVFIVQDVRGRYLSEGEYAPFQNEGLDGYTTVEWAGKAPWSNGNVVLYGFSYLGSCAWLSVPYNSPYLKTIVPMFTTQDTYSMFISRGIFHLKGTLYWLSSYRGKLSYPKSFEKVKKVFMNLPVCQLDSQVMGHPDWTYQNVLHHIVPDDFWAKICVNQRMYEINIPACIVTGWYDTYLKGAIKDFNRMMTSAEHTKNPQSILIIGPWSHNPSQRFSGMEFGSHANFNLQFANTLKWCNYWLKGDLDALKGFKKVKYFMMGINKWYDSDEWPPKNVTMRNYYLSAENNNKKRCVYKLEKKTSEDVSTIHYTYDPRNPVPFRGSHHLYDPSWVGPFEQGELFCRKDVIIYMSPPLEEDIHMAGEPKLILYVSSSAVDTDFYAKLCDMRPSEESYNLQAGSIRMRYRESLHMPTLIEPGKVYRLEINLGSIAHTFLKGHRIQLQITSSDFPVHDRNLNTGASSEFSTSVCVAEQTIYTGGYYPSHLILPVLQT